ncbi:hypothetical protein SPONN_1166 [uncultured Candidatus Thioglobus sp.]|nr:hypothetical protein SPONN_1166 [uncultured Candidatus Thioglobus sp.]
MWSSRSQYQQLLKLDYYIDNWEHLIVNYVFSPGELSLVASVAIMALEIVVFASPPDSSAHTCTVPPVTSSETLTATGTEMVTGGADSAILHSSDSMPNATVHSVLWPRGPPTLSAIFNSNFNWPVSIYRMFLPLGLGDRTTSIERLRSLLCTHNTPMAYSLPFSLTNIIILLIIFFCNHTKTA